MWLPPVCTNRKHTTYIKFGTVHVQKKPCGVALRCIAKQASSSSSPSFPCSTTCCVYVRASHQKTHECTCILPGSRTLLHSVWVFCCQRPLWVSFPLEKAWLTPCRYLPKNKALQPLLRVLLQQRKARKNSGMIKRKQ